MARSIYFMAFLVLAMTLFVAYGVQGQNICKTKSKFFEGLCWLDSSCRKVCIEKDKFEDGHCSKLRRLCLCTKICAFENTPNEVKNKFVDEAKYLKEALLEKELMME
ncbi:defensin-like protein [Capsicum galapagoense]